MYCTYIVPLLEYTCELRDGCNIQNFNKIKQIHQEAARIVTALPKFSGIDYLCFEHGLEP